MNKLYFINNEFHKGINYTVRLGKYWYYNLHYGQEISINGLNAIITKLLWTKYGNIPSYVFKKEHDSSCRNYDGLDNAMQKAYHNKFNDNDLLGYYNQIVTIIGFKIKKR